MITYTLRYYVGSTLQRYCCTTVALLVDSVVPVVLYIDSVVLLFHVFFCLVMLVLVLIWLSLLLLFQSSFVDAVVIAVIFVYA